MPDAPTFLPCADHVETCGVVFFARLLHKIRLSAAGLLPADYNLGPSNPTSFDARFCRFWEIDFDALTARTLQGGTDEEIFDWLFAGRTLNPEHVLIWNNALLKRGWRDDGSDELAETKKACGFGDRDDIQTYADFHDADEGRKPRFA